ncbi:MAG: LptF/LptG family permease [Candidatus Omnitrophica bacterium]|nr:LptF/LptG family permease [Candidatus Omnitrophota bacterium]
MSILRMYVLKEHAAPLAVTATGLTLVALVGNLVKLAELVITKGVSVFDVLRLLIYSIPYLLTFTLPIACLIAMVMAFGRLSSDYELIAMRASGIAPATLVLPMVMAGLLISGGMLALNDRVIPETHLASRRQLKAIGIKHPTAYIEAGTFIKEFEPYVLFVYHVDRQMLYNVRIYEPQPNGPTRTIIAQRGEFEPLPDRQGVRLKLYEGTVDEWNPEHPGSLYKVSFRTYTMNMITDSPGGRGLGKKLKEMTFNELLRERQRLSAEGIDAMPASLEFHRKIAFSFATVIFIVFGLSVGLSLHHHERLVIFVWVLGWSVVYYLGSIGMNALALKGWMTPWLAMWLPNVIGGTFGAARLWQTLRH